MIVISSIGIGSRDPLSGGTNLKVGVGLYRYFRSALWGARVAYMNGDVRGTLWMDGRYIYPGLIAHSIQGAHRFHSRAQRACIDINLNSRSEKPL